MKALITSIKKIKFINSHVQKLFMMQAENNQPATTPSVNYCKINPTPIENPALISISKSLCETMEIDFDSILSNEAVGVTTNCLAGNEICETSVPVSHCYCGYQFGNFAGQLGDGRAITIGDYYTSSGEVWEMQLKGSGPTPYSRFADGRAVLRSSIREYFASEHLYELGIPTTRALSLIKSDTLVQRDPNYNGKIIMEKCAVVCRVAPSFIRFGSFEIFKDTDYYTGSKGPSTGLEKEMLPTMIDYLINTHFKNIKDEFIQTQQSLKKTFEVIVKRTAVMAALWHAYGFSHGVINTDNMSILGLTIDYGPYGQIEFYDRNYVPNSSDSKGRYAFFQQPEICKWNLSKLAESISPELKIEESSELISQHYDSTFEFIYNLLLSRKLGFVSLNPEIKVLITDLIELLEVFSFDLSEFYRNLSKVVLGPSNDNIAEFIENSCSSSLDYSSRLNRCKPKIPKHNLEKLEDAYLQNPEYLLTLGIDSWFIKYAKSLLSDTDKVSRFGSEKSFEENKRKELSKWLEMFLKIHNNEDLESIAGTLSKTQLEAHQNLLLSAFQYPLPEGVFKNKVLSTEKKILESTYSIKSKDELGLFKYSMMNDLNPRFVLRRRVIQNAIKNAEKDDFSVFNEQLNVYTSPFSDHKEVNYESNYSVNFESCKDDICLSCSS